jgi:hypothetical protein
MKDGALNCFKIYKAEVENQLERKIKRIRSDRGSEYLSYPVFMPKSNTHRVHDPGSNVPHIRPKGFTENQMS